MNITLVYASAPRVVHEQTLNVPPSFTVQQVLELAGWNERFPEIRTLSTGIWNRKATRDTVLREGDRLEVYRELRVDPKQARRERFVGQGVRGAGLFASRRPGSKSGY